MVNNNLVGGWANPSEKYESVGMMTFPTYGKNKTWFKPPTRFFANKNLDVMFVMCVFLDCTWMLRCFRSSDFFLVVIGGNGKLKWRFGDASMGINGYQWVSMKMVPEGNNSWASVRISYELVIQILMLKIMILKDETYWDIVKPIDSIDHWCLTITIAIVGGDSDSDNEGWWCWCCWWSL